MGDKSQFTTDEQRWAAIMARLGPAHGAFVYGVITTGIYCRPTCPSRRPKRENVLYFDQASQAEEKGSDRVVAVAPTAGRMNCRPTRELWKPAGFWPSPGSSPD